MCVANQCYSLCDIQFYTALLPRVAAIVQCRLEANYAHQQELDMIPLMMQKDYSPKGWRKSQSQSVGSGRECRRHATDVRQCLP